MDSATAGLVTSFGGRPSNEVHEVGYVRTLSNSDESFIVNVCRKQDSRRL